MLSLAGARRWTREGAYGAGRGAPVDLAAARVQVSKRAKELLQHRAGALPSPFLTPLHWVSPPAEGLRERERLRLRKEPRTSHEPRKHGFSTARSAGAGGNDVCAADEPVLRGAAVFAQTRVDAPAAILHAGAWRASSSSSVPSSVPQLHWLAGSRSHWRPRAACARASACPAMSQLHPLCLTRGPCAGGTEQAERARRLHPVRNRSMVLRASTQALSCAACPAGAN